MVIAVLPITAALLLPLMSGTVRRAVGEDEAPSPLMTLLQHVTGALLAFWLGVCVCDWPAVVSAATGLVLMAAAVVLWVFTPEVA